MTIVKSAYIKKTNVWILKNNNLTSVSLNYFYNLQLILTKKIFIKSQLKYTIIPIYYNSIKLLNDISFFPALRYSFFINYRFFKRLLYLSPSTIFILETSKGLLSNLNITNKKLSGRIVAICV